MNNSLIRAALVLVGLVGCADSIQAAPAWGSFERPFKADSPWNSKPVNPQLGEYTIADVKYVPTIASGIYSTGVFYADASMPPMVVGTCDGKKGVYDDDAEEFKPSVRIPHWPTATAPSGSGDGAAEIVDVDLGIVHSFYQLRQSNGTWCATQYGWTALAGRGWGDPAHYHQGSRASGMSVLGGLIRTHEVHDGDDMYRHALAMSLDISGLSPEPAYIYPASSADWNAATENKGLIPQGTLMMLPKYFDISKITTPRLRKIAATLKEYGAYVVDRNYGTPYVIYAEIGSDTYLHKPKWDVVAVAELQLIQKWLKPVVATDGWVSGDGVYFKPEPKRLNILSMRGKWLPLSGTTAGAYDTWKQAYVFPAIGKKIQMASFSPNIMARTSWSKPSPGSKYRLKSTGSGGGTMRLQLNACVGAGFSVDTGDLSDGQPYDFLWPREICSLRMTISNSLNSETVVKGTLILID